VRHSADENPRMPLTFADGQPFGIGATAYQYHPASAHENTPQITPEVSIEWSMTHAMVNIGASYPLRSCLSLVVSLLAYQTVRWQIGYAHYHPAILASPSANICYHVFSNILLRRE